MDSGDLIQLAAYVVFFIIIAGAGVVRKLLEAKKRRQEEERRQGRSRPVIGRPHTPAPADQPAAEEIPPPKPEAPQLDLEDIFRKAFGIPDDPAKQRPKPTVIKTKRQTAMPVEDVQPFRKPVSPAVLTAQPGIADDRDKKQTPPEKEPSFSWQGFMDSLDERGLTGVQKAIILTEVFNKPPALRRFKR
jgi:hypothetical protein